MKNISQNITYLIKESGEEHMIRFCKDITDAIKEAKKHNIVEIWKYEETIRAYRKYREYSHGKMIWKAPE